MKKQRIACRLSHTPQGGAPTRGCSRRLVERAGICASLLSLLFCSAPGEIRAQVAASYTEFILPGEAQQIWDIFVDLDNDPVLRSAWGIHYLVTVVASVDDTIIYPNVAEESG